MNYSLETCNEASVGGRGGEWWAGESSCSFPQREQPLLSFFFFFFCLFTSLFLLHTFPSPCLPPHTFSCALILPQHSPHAHYRRLTQHICRPLCVLMCPFITGLNVKSIHGVHLMTTVPVCLCVAVSLYVVKFAVFQHLIVFVCFWVLSLLRRSF